jgi:hypothetical protein
MGDLVFGVLVSMKAMCRCRLNTEGEEVHERLAKGAGTGLGRSELGGSPRNSVTCGLKPDQLRVLPLDRQV